MIKLQTPLQRQDILKLKIGDEVLVSGTVFTARDKAHKFLAQSNFKPIQGAVIYHCGPIVKDGQIIVAGPTTSSRMNAFMPAIIKRYQTPAIIGKGGIDEATRKALKGRAVYLSAIGGAACLYADKIKVVDVYKKDFGLIESIWQLEVKDFPVIVTMDAHGRSLYDIVQKTSQTIFSKKIKS